MNNRRPSSVKPGLSSVTPAAPVPRTHSGVATFAAAGVLTLFGGQPAFAQGAGTVLPAGTIPQLRGVVSGQAVVNAPLATPTGSLLTIDQQSQRVVIDWNKFNIGNGSEVRFNQPSATAAALNRIYSADPTIIQGKLTANGQVFLINQNGILFDRGAQVNVGALVASTLNRSNAAFATGLVGGPTQPAFEGGYDAAGNSNAVTGSGTLQVGAYGDPAAAAPTINASPGGFIIMVAPVINNRSGVITSPDGQVILAAGSKAYLNFGDGLQGRPRGFVVEISADDGPVDITSLIRNNGTISSDRGNVTLAGLAINQSGRVSASTAALLNGSIFLQATTSSAGAATVRSGTVTLARGSVTETPIDTVDKTTLTEDASYSANRALIKVDAKTIVNNGAITAPGGVVTLSANDAVDPLGSRIYLGEGSSISTAGTWADVDYGSNLLTFNVTSNELKNSPLQKSGVLRGATVTVDLRKGSDILDLSGYVAGRTRTVQEKATPGGDVEVRSAGSLIQRAGAVIDVSGGGYRYGSGIPTTTKLLGANGKVYDIASAPKDLAYTTILDTFEKRFSRWGQVDVYKNVLYGTAGREAEYVEGKPGGNLLITSGAGAVLDGTLRGGATIGATQLNSAPRGGSLVIGSFDSTIRTQNFGIANISFRANEGDSLGAGFAADTVLGGPHADLLELSASLFPNVTYGADETIRQSGFDRVELGANGRITVPSGIDLRTPIGGTLIMRARQIEVAGSVSAPAGRIGLQTFDTVGATPIDSIDQQIAIESGGALSATGLWLNNDSRSGAPVGSPLPFAIANASGSPSSSIQGGSVSLTSPSVRTAVGSAIDVGGGGSLSSVGRLTAGNGGSIVVAADPLDLAGSSTRLDGDLRGFALGRGGNLAITLGTVLVGTDPTTAARNAVDPGLFMRGGFSGFDLTGVGGLTVAANTALRPIGETLVIDVLEAAKLATGGDIASIANHVLLPDYQRSPTNLALRAQSTVSGSAAALDLKAGASIVTDSGAAITLASTGNLTVSGHVEAPAGSITLSLKGINNALPTPELLLGSDSELLARGTFVAKPSSIGLRQGSVLNGGSVTLDTGNASIVTRAGSKIDVSGASELIDYPQADGATPIVTHTITSDAGNVLVRAQGAVRADGDVIGAAQGRSAGGSFALELTGRNDLIDSTQQRRIVVNQGTASTSMISDPTFIDATFNVDSLVRGGIDKLRLQSENRIRFASDVALDFRRGIRLDTPLLDVGPGAQVVVTGSSVTLANSFGVRRSTGNESSLDNSAPSPIIATRPGNGQFEVHGQTVDLFGALTINGVSNTRLTSDNDLRLTGRQVGSPSVDTDSAAVLIGSLSTAGNIELNATQVYPTTRSAFSITVASQPGGALIPGARVEVNGNGKIGGEVLSAGGSVSIRADSITQDGIVRAPLGTIALNAGSALELGANSTTSVTAAGTVIPYGTTQDGLTLQYASTGLISVPPAKQISLAGRKVDIRNGATVDISGGGDILAVEFQRGSGGDRDTLLQDNTFAILPAARLTSMPIDSDIASLKDLGFGRDASIYNSIHIGAGGIVPEGDYVLLPGHYALLPDAYLVQLQTSGAYANLVAGTTAKLPSGFTVVPGRRAVAGTDIQESQTIGVVVRPGSDAKKESDYLLSNAEFFSRSAALLHRPSPRLPADGGRLTIAATESLLLDGALKTAPATFAASTGAPQAAEVDLSAAFIAIVDRVGQAGIDSKYLQIDAGSLSRIDGSLLVGGTRSDFADGVRISAVASDVRVANSGSSPLQAPELILAARDSINIETGSVLSGRGGNVPVGRNLAADPSGALIRLSNGDQIGVDRGTSLDASTGEVNINAGATLRADGALLIDATRNLRSQGDLVVAAGGSLGLASSQVSLGETAGIPGLTSGLVLSNADLAGFNQLGTLAIKSYTGIDLYGQASLGSAALERLTLDSAALAARGSAPVAARIAARQVTLTQSRTLLTTASTGLGRLSIDAGEIVLGAGDKALSGFGTIALNASGDLTAAGSGSLHAAGDLNISAARIASQSGANQTWQAVDASNAVAPTWFNVNITANPASSVPAATALGSRLTVEGKRISSAGNIAIASGIVTLAARGSLVDDGISLLSGAKIDAGGAAREFNGAMALAGGGIVNLVADHGAVNIGVGATVNVSSAAEGGDAGTVKLAGSSVTVDGGLSGAGVANGSGGHFLLDAGGLANFSALNAKLNDGGFTAQRDLRVRTGDVRVAAADVVTARQVTLAADAGRVDVDGVIDARSPQGNGVVRLAAPSVGLSAGSRIDANGTSTASSVDAPYANGGTVRVETGNGLLQFAPGATIDVRSGEKGSAGQVTFAAARTASNGVQAELRGTVLSQRHVTDAPAEVVVEGRRVETFSGSLSASAINGFAATNAAFVTGANVAAIAGQINGDDGLRQTNLHVRGALEVQSPGDLTLAVPWNLATTQWLAGSEAGTLTLRARGNLTISSALGLPNDDLAASSSWNLRLVGGADLNAANPLSVRASGDLSTTGDVTLTGVNAKVRTGTGSIDIAAGRDFRITDPRGVVYTSGVASVPDPTPNGTSARWAKNGGNITISAQRNAVGVSNEWITDWMRRARGASTSQLTGEWWAYRPNFRQNIGSFAGGDIAIGAGNNVSTLSALSASSGRTFRDSSGILRLDVQGGGDVAVRAGNDLIGGEYLVARGAGDIRAGGSVGAITPTQLYLMGESNDPALGKASIRVEAGENIAIQSINNPTVLPLTRATGTGTGPSFVGALFSSSFFTYSGNSAVTLRAKGGDVSFARGLSSKPPLVASDSAAINAYVPTVAAYPANLDAIAFDGDIVGQYSSTDNVATAFFPSPAGEVRYLAGRGISNVGLSVSSLSSTSVPSWSNFTTVASNSLSGATLLSGTSRDTTHTSSGPYAYDVQALGGDISNAFFSFPAASRIWAREDIGNFSFVLQNLNASDVSVVHADQGDVRPNTLNTEIRGPGRLVVQAGGTIDLGPTFTGLLATGNVNNTSLAVADSARITLVAGVSGEVDFSKLDAAFAEIVEAGKVKDNGRAQSALQAFLGSAKVRTGNIFSYNTSVQTFNGSGIDLIAPAGDIVVGLTTPNATRTVGVITNGGGAIQSVLNGNFSINQGKVVTAQGGDIVIYTGTGNIDAGRGAKTSRTTPAPQRLPVEVNGVLVGFRYVLPVGVAGSGIQTVTSDPDGPGPILAPTPGSIFLFAPTGTIDAGEAGIVSGANIFIAAQQVLNAVNISAQGTSVGVPQAVAGSLAASVASSGAGNTTAGATKAAEDAARAASAAPNVGETFKPSILTVEVLGFGEKNCKETQKDCFPK